jgi:hypothetical protein
MTKARLRMGMVGGGPRAFIGPVYRIATELDREIDLRTVPARGNVGA